MRAFARLINLNFFGEEEEEEEMSLSARGWGCWLSDSLWVGPPVSRAP